MEKRSEKEKRREIEINMMMTLYILRRRYEHVGFTAGSAALPKLKLF